MFLRFPATHDVYLHCDMCLKKKQETKSKKSLIYNIYQHITSSMKSFRPQRKGGSTR